MNTLLLAVIVIVGVAFLVTLARGTGGSSEFPYQLSKYLLSKAERSFYGVLVQAIGSSGLVFSKVRVADVIAPKKGLSQSDWQRAFNAISSKHLDFVICSPGDCSVQLAIELDDSSHGSAKAQKRDNLLNGACESAGLPLLRIKAANSYVVADIQRLVQEAISPPQEALANSVMPVVSEQSVAVATPVEDPNLQVGAQAEPLPEETANSFVPTEPVPTSLACPKCGEPMLLRKAKSGANAGQEFWGVQYVSKVSCRGEGRCITSDYGSDSPVPQTQLNVGVRRLSEEKSHFCRATNCPAVSMCKSYAHIVESVSP